MTRAVFLVLSLSTATIAPAQDWPQFRGPRGSGVSQESGLPTQWSESENIRWKVEIPGTGHSSPIVFGDRVFVTTAVGEKKAEVPKKGLYFGGNRSTPEPDEHQWTILCLDRNTGKTLWNAVAIRRKPSSPIHVKNSYASSTPVTDGRHVYAFFGSEGLYCFDMEGKKVWERDFGVLKTVFDWGPASSPVLHGDTLFLQCDTQKESFLIALDKATGETRWKVDRQEKSTWSTPLVWETDTRTELVTAGSAAIRSYDPATGKLLWELAPMSNIAAPTPVAGHGLVFVSSGYVLDKVRPVYAVRPDSSGELKLKAGETKSESIAWSHPLAGPYIPSPIVYGDYLYVLLDRGFLSCYDARSGKEIYGRTRIAAGAGSFSASPIAYDGKIFCASEDGDTYVIQAGPEFKVLAVNSLGEFTMATPAASRGQLFIRTFSHLYCIANGARLSRSR